MTNKDARGNTPLWRNRITDHGAAKPADLIANPRNWRQHPRAQQAALAEMLDSVGWVQDVVVNARTGHIIDGHLRVSLALSRNEEEIPVVYVDLAPDEEALVLASLDPLAAMAVSDTDMLAELLAGIQTDGALGDMLAALMPVEASDILNEWEGMPEFAQEDQEAWKSLRVNFACAEDLDAFGRLLAQPINDTTRSIWFPPVPIVHKATMRFFSAAEPQEL